MKYSLAEILSTSDYYPFGMQMPGRVFNSQSTRYGFNGKENDREWGTSLIQNYGFRLYNPALGKFLSVDPLMANFPWWTPYQFAGNTPIQALDLDGLEILDYRSSIFYMGIGKSKLSNFTFIHAGNIPEVNKTDYKTRTQTGQFLVYGNWSMPTTSGRDPSVPTFLQKISQGKPIPEFWGDQETQSMEDIEDIDEVPTNLRGNNLSQFGGGTAGATPMDKGATVFDAVQHASGIWGNISNRKIWKANGKVFQDKRAYYRATYMVDKFISQNKNLNNSTSRSFLVNLVLDGSMFASVDINNPTEVDLTKSKAIVAYYEIAFEILNNNDINISDKMNYGYEDAKWKQKTIENKICK